jgi:hypothetical protein
VFILNKKPPISYPYTLREDGIDSDEEGDLVC